MFTVTNHKTEFVISPNDKKSRQADINSEKTSRHFSILTSYSATCQKMAAVTYRSRTNDNSDRMIILKAHKTYHIAQ